MRPGKYDSAARTTSEASASSSASRCDTPLLRCTRDPPRSAAVTISRVTRAMTRGPVRNICESSPTIITSVPSDGEYAAPPAQGPQMTLICGTLAREVARKIDAYAPSAATPSCRRAPPECRKPTTGAPALLAASIVEQIVVPPACPSEPPLCLTFCAQT